ncbi:hypothetical protein KQX54_019174 [Cotesia glomerata]|uniref:Uncharacterized protein n=1 Tax=Cotesia glomerata TaxID=32391 RepID=A0AAV7IS62_COTGL|nr:hypothetical protein KQX54_019174 [Cotesia glomerata]
MAANIIRDDIRMTPYEPDIYPSGEDLIKQAEKYVPKSLKLLLSNIIGDKDNDNNSIEKKVLDIAHTIMAAYPSSLYPESPPGTYQINCQRGSNSNTFTRSFPPKVITGNVPDTLPMYVKYIFWSRFKSNRFPRSFSP